MIDLDRNTIDLNFFKNLIRELNRNEHKRLDDIFDSFSRNQFKSKTKLIKSLEDLKILDNNSEVVILGSWYGSILVSCLHNKVNKITCFDMDDVTIRVAKNRIFPNIENVMFATQDVFNINEGLIESIKNSNLIINTSCEHMPSMKEWPYWANVSKNCYFAFTSNNMYNIEGHINCVECIEEFKEQLPENSIVSIEEEITDERGTRYLLVGKIS